MRWLALCGATALIYAAGPKPDTSDVKDVLTGTAAFDTFQTEKPGTFRKITVADLPQPYATQGVGNPPTIVPRPANAWPQAPEGFKVQLYAQNLIEPREIKAAPNGDFFVAESHGNKIDVFRGITGDGKPEQTSTFATGLHNPFGIAFYPQGDNPQWVYIANTNSVVRFPYKNGDLKAGGAPETIIPELPSGGGHWTRDLAFSPDGSKLFVSVGSGSNVDDPDTHPAEHHRANILEYNPDGTWTAVD